MTISICLCRPTHFQCRLKLTDDFRVNGSCLTLAWGIYIMRQTYLYVNIYVFLRQGVCLIKIGLRAITMIPHVLSSRISMSAETAECGAVINMIETTELSKLA